MPSHNLEERQCSTNVLRITSRLFKKAVLLTRPTLARRDAPLHKYGRSERRGEGILFPVRCASERCDNEDVGLFQQSKWCGADCGEIRMHKRQPPPQQNLVLTLPELIRRLCANQAALSPSVAARPSFLFNKTARKKAPRAKTQITRDKPHRFRPYTAKPLTSSCWTPRVNPGSPPTGPMLH